MYKSTVLYNFSQVYCESEMFYVYFAIVAGTNVFKPLSRFGVEYCERVVKQSKLSFHRHIFMNGKIRLT